MPTTRFKTCCSRFTLPGTYDPSCPFGPWLVAMANGRIIDRLRR